MIKAHSPFDNWPASDALATESRSSAHSFERLATRSFTGPSRALADDVRDVPRRYVERVAVRSLHRIVIVPVDEIARLEADDNYVRIWSARMYPHHETLTGLLARLDPKCSSACTGRTP